MLVNYDYYIDHYLGSAISSDDDFLRLEKKAEIVLRKITFGNIKEEDGEYGYNVRGSFIPFEDVELKSLKEALCHAIEVLKTIQDGEAKALSGNDRQNIKSMSSGGESVTYDAAHVKYEEAYGSETAKTQILRDVIMNDVDIYTFRFNPFYAGVR